MTFEVPLVTNYDLARSVSAAANAEDGSCGCWHTGLKLSFIPELLAFSGRVEAIQTNNMY